MPSAQPLRLPLSPSPAFAALIVTLHGVAAACFLTIMTAWSGALLAVLLLALGVAAARDRALLRAESSPVEIEIRASGEAYCRFANGETAVAQALGGNGITRGWVALRLRSPARRAVLVVGGMLRAEEFRLLRLWARWGKLPGVAPRQLPA